MKCKICLDSKKKVYKLKEKILGTSIIDLIVNTARVNVPKGSRSCICFECCISLYQAKTIIDKAQNAFVNLDKSATGSKANECSENGDDTLSVKKRKKSAVENGAATNGVPDDADSTLSNLPIVEAEDSTNNTTFSHSPSKEKKILNQGKYTCLSCGKIFSDTSKLQNHIDKIHKKHESFNCPNCGVLFRSKDKYDSHVFNEKCSSSIYPCQEGTCNKRFSNMKAVQTHMNKFHPLSIYCASNASEI